MAEESFLLVSLQDEKAKKLSQVIASDTARRILDALSKKKYTETELAKELSMPISTAHYNLEQLKNAGLVKATEYHYSSKGKEVMHYELVNKLIIISPGKEREGMLDLLKKFLPMTIIAGAISVGISLYQKSIATPSASPMMKAAVEDAAAPRLMAAIPEPVALAEPSIALWFFIGAMAVVGMMLALELVKRRK